MLNASQMLEMTTVQLETYLFLPMKSISKRWMFRVEMGNVIFHDNVI